MNEPRPENGAQYIGRTVVAEHSIDQGWPCGMPGIVWRVSGNILCIRTREPGDVHYSANARFEDVELMPVGCTESYVDYKSMQHQLTREWRESEGHYTERIAAWIARLQEGWDKLSEAEQCLVGTRPKVPPSWEQPRPPGTPLSRQLKKEIAEFPVLGTLNAVATGGEIPVEFALVSMVKALATELRRRKEIQGMIDELKTTPEYLTALDRLHAQELLNLALQPFIGRTLDAGLISQLHMILAGVINHVRTR